MSSEAHLQTGDDPAFPAGLRALWDEAREWVGWLLSMFDRNTLRTTGVSREQGARLSTWLMNIEGAVRRIVLPAALTLSPPAPRRPHAIATRLEVPTHLIANPQAAGDRRA